MSRKRKKHTEEMKARVALEAIKGVRTLSELSAAYGVGAEKGVALFFLETGICRSVYLMLGTWNSDYLNKRRVDHGEMRVRELFFF